MSHDFSLHWASMMPAEGSLWQSCLGASVFCVLEDCMVQSQSFTRSCTFAAHWWTQSRGGIVEHVQVDYRTPVLHLQILPATGWVSMPT